jgi:hypothetical protein
MKAVRLRRIDRFLLLAFLFVLGVLYHHIVWR